MELEREYATFAAEKAIEILNIDSPTGFTKKAASWVLLPWCYFMWHCWSGLSFWPSDNDPPSAVCMAIVSQAYCLST